MTSQLVLNVDDNDGARYAKTRLLRNAGFKVAEATTGKEALDMAAALGPDVVLLDVRLPDINGLDVCRRSKAGADTSVAKVVQTSAAYITAEDIAMGYESGADGYITSPYDPRDLISFLRSACSSSSMSARKIA